MEIIVNFINLICYVLFSCRDCLRNEFGFMELGKIVFGSGFEAMSFLYIYNLNYIKF